MGIFLILLFTVAAAVHLPHGAVQAPGDQRWCGVPAVRPDDWLDPHLFRHVSHPHLFHLQSRHSRGIAYGGKEKNMFIEFFLNQFNGQLFKMRYVNGNISHIFSLFFFEKGTGIAFIQNI